MKKGIIAVVGVILLLLVLIVPSYNGLVALEEQVDGSWSQVENVLKRRADLIPNLVNTVKGYASHEEEVFLGVTRARSGLETANGPEEMAEANDQLTAALSRLNVVVESYPELKADKNFTQLMDELAGTENRIATERQRYNEKVQEYNTKIKRFPTRIVAGLLGFDAKEYFKVASADKEVPTVDFNN